MKRFAKNAIYGVDLETNSPESIAAEGLAYALSTTALRKGRIVQASTFGAHVARLDRKRNQWVFIRCPYCQLPGSVLMRAEMYIEAHVSQDQIPDEDWPRRVCEWLKGYSYDAWVNRPDRGPESPVLPERAKTRDVIVPGPKGTWYNLWLKFTFDWKDEFVGWSIGAPMMSLDEDLGTPDLVEKFNNRYQIKGLWIAPNPNTDLLELHYRGDPFRILHTNMV